MKFGLVSTKEQYETIAQFAKSFPDGTHGVGNMTLPIVTMSNEKGLCGYFTQIRHPINLPAWHPELVSHREFLESVKVLTANQQIMSISDQFPNGVAYVGLDVDNPLIPKLEKLGFEDTRVRLFRSL